MRLVFDTPGRFCGAGLNRYNGRGIYGTIGRKVLLSGLRNVTKTVEEYSGIADAESDDLNKGSAESMGLGVDASSTDKLDDSEISNTSNIDKFTKPNLDEESSTETIVKLNDHTEVDPVNDDKLNDDSGVDNKASQKTEPDVAGIKRKFPPSFVNSIINKNIGDDSQPKLQRLDSSFMDCSENNDASTNSDVDECDTQPSEQVQDKKEDHSLIKIPPTKRKKYAQKVCVHCRHKYSVRNDTRYICTLCDIALCKEPCFAEYHCNK